MIKELLEINICLIILVLLLFIIGSFCLQNWHIVLLMMD